MLTTSRSPRKLRTIAANLQNHFLKKIHPLLLSLLSGLLLFAAWPVSPFTFLIFAAFIPLLWLEAQVTKRAQFFGWTYLTMLVWNGATTWWVCNSTVAGGIAAIVANALLMCLPWIGFYNIKRRMGPLFAYPALILFWLTFEYIHLNWELSWPWLTIGNVFATHPGWVQWYEFTGTSGGTLWVLVINVLLFAAFTAAKKGPARTARLLWISFAATLLIPFLLSWLLAGNIKEEAASIGPTTPNVVIVQPNIDPWDEKFAAGKQEGQLQKMIHLSESLIDGNTALVVWPETAVPVQINEDEMKTNYFMAPVWDFLRRHPGINLLTGVEGYRIYSEQDKTPYSSRIPQTDKYADSYNSAALLDSNSFQVYHKSRLVPGVEILPSFLKFMTPIFEKFGGTTGGYARQKERTMLATYNHSYRVAPAVCYESIYGEFMTAYIRNGADLIAVITNDGWWGNTSGYRQHMNYARLRAIETRRWLVRSANTGVSCFIDPSGGIIDPQPWDTTAVIKRAVPINKGLTFYTQHEDLVSKGAIAAFVLLILLNLLVIFLPAEKLPAFLTNRRSRG